MKRTFCLFLLGLLSFNLVNADDHLPMIVAFYPFDENAVDFSGNGNNGIDLNVSFLPGGTGKVGVFSRTSSVRVADNKSFDFSSEGGASFCVRVKQESRTSGYLLVKMGPGERADNEYYLSLTGDGHLAAGFTESSSNYKDITSKTILILDTWYDVILIWKKSGEISLYVDGELDTLTTSIVTSIQNTGFPFVIGDPDTVDSHSFVGSAEDIYVYNRALSSSEIEEFSIYSKPNSLNPNTNEEDCLIYPNPVTDEVSISTSLKFRNSRYRITGIDGKLMLSGTLKAEKDRLDLNSLKPGIYTIQIDNGKSIISRKIFKQ